MKKMEHKTVAERIEVKFAADEAATKTFDGYGAYFGNADDYGDVIQAGAFAKSIAQFKAKNAMPAMLWNHDQRAMPIGIWTDISEDSRGLKVSGKFLDTTAGNDAYTITKEGAVTGLSIGYFVTGFEVVKNGSDVSRLITEVKLFEISVVTFPANSMAQISDVKSMDDDDDEDCDCDDPDRDPDDEACDECEDEYDSLFKSLVAKGYDPDATTKFLKSLKSSQDEDDDDSDADDAEDDAETKYNIDAAMVAVKELCQKLKQECHGR